MRQVGSRGVRFVVAFVLVMALVVGGLPHGVALAGGIQKQRVLHPSALGRSTDTSGVARVRKDGARQVFKVSMDARVANGRVYRVYITNSAHPGRTYLAGRIVIRLGRGGLSLSNANGVRLRPSVAPVLRIKTVTVRNAAGKIVLRGSF